MHRELNHNHASASDQLYIQSSSSLGARCTSSTVGRREAGAQERWRCALHADAMHDLAYAACCGISVLKTFDPFAACDEQRRPASA